MLNNPLAPPGGQTPPAGDPPGQTTNLPGQTPQQQQPPGQTPPAGHRTSLDDMPQDIQDLVRGLRKEAKETREALEAKLKTEQAATEAKLKEQGEYKTLAEKHEARVKELEPIQARYQSLAELVSEQIKAETKDWPQSVKALDPGKDAPIEERLAWKTRAQAIVAELATTARGTLPGNRPNPPPQGQRTQEELIAANRRDLQKSRTYGI